MKIINVNLQENPYKIYIKDNLAKELPLYFNRLNVGNFCFIITNERIFSLHKARIKKIVKDTPYKIIKVAEGEKAKSKKWLFKLLEELLNLDKVISRRPFVVCLGGGTIGDLGGFAASIYKRGIPCIQIPTTLLACVDAAIGGKTAIDLKEAKNIVGSFYQPKAVFIDPQFLNTLAAKEIKQGFAEIIKYSLIKDKGLFEKLKNNYKKIKEFEPGFTEEIIESCVKIKAGIVEKDEREKKGIRTILNFGHTIGHALEASSGYKKSLNHGESVALGMICAGQISLYLKLCPKAIVEKIRALIKLYKLPLKTSFDREKVIKSFSFDKKFISGSIRMVLIEHIGKTRICEKIPLKLVKKSLEIIRQ
ncbi:MAG: 3-dehydroquinate synthase [Candidatus Omnitrophica bacterium]|nr:3-dehydroquinate synthase [Candidatus Omnitrophota bacterium]